MQQFIQSIFLVIGTAVITNFFTRKIYLSDKDRDIVLIYIMISLIFWRLKYPEQFTEQISVIIIAIFIILVFSIYYIGCVFIQNFIYFKKYYFLFKQRKALPQKDIGDKKNYNNYKKQSN